MLKLFLAAMTVALAVLAGGGTAPAEPPRMRSDSGAVPLQFSTWGKTTAPSPYLGDPGLNSAGTGDATATADEQTRGFIFFSKPSSFDVMPDFVPASADRSTSLAAADSPGQYGPISVFLFALGETGSHAYSMTVSDLVSTKGGKIAAQNFDVRSVRYIKASGGGSAYPLLLESPPSTVVYAKRLQQFWITYYIPPGAAAGAYTGEVHISVDGDQKLSVPLTLTVYPFTPPALTVPIWMCYDAPRGGTTTLAGLANDLNDQKLHGMNMGKIMPVITNDKLDLAQTTPQLDVYKSIFPKSIVVMELYDRITSRWVNDFRSVNTTPKMWGRWTVFDPLYPLGQYDAVFLKGVGDLNAAAKSRGLTLQIEVADEPETHQWTIKAAQHYLALVRDNYRDVIRYEDGGGGFVDNENPPDKLFGLQGDGKGPLVQVFSTNRWSKEGIARLQKNDPGVVINLYNMAGHVSAQPGTKPSPTDEARQNFGFFSWYVNSSVGDTYEYDPGASQADERYAWPAAAAGQGKLPTIAWEQSREGVKDLMYVKALEAAIKGRSGPVVKQAQACLDSIRTQMDARFQGFDFVTGGFMPTMPSGTYETWREQINQFMVQLGGR